MTADAGSYPPRLAVGAISTRVLALPPPARMLHKAIMRSFATTGHAPDLESLAGMAPGGYDLRGLLRELHNRDVVRLDRVDDHHVAGIRIRAAYPFSGRPTAHRVTIAGGPTVSAMCAVDALGIAHMLGKDVTIDAIDPASGAAVRVQLAVRDGQAIWEPEVAVVVVGSATSTAGACAPGDGGGCGVTAADRSCGTTNFFTSSASAAAWLGEHPQVAGVILTKEQALQLGVDIFGQLLDD